MAVLRRKVEELTQGVRPLDRELAEAEHAVQQAEQELAELGRQMESLQRQTDELIKIIETLGDKCEKFEAKVEEGRQTERELADKQSELEAEMQRTQADISANEDKQQLLRGEIVAAARCRHELNQAADAAERQVASPFSTELSISAQAHVYDEDAVQSLEEAEWLKAHIERILKEDVGERERHQLVQAVKLQEVPHRYHHSESVSKSEQARVVYARCHKDAKRQLAVEAQKTSQLTETNAEHGRLKEKAGNLQKSIAAIVVRRDILAARMRLNKQDKVEV